MQGYNKAVIRKLSNRNLLNHKKRSLLMILIIAILTMLITTLGILTESTFKSLENSYFQKYGNKSHVQLEGISEQEIKKIESYPEVRKYGISIRVGEAVNKEFGGRPTQLRYDGGNYARDTLSLPSQGKMPEYGNEIAMDTSVLSDLGIKAGLGKAVRLTWIGQNGIEKSRDFVVAGIWEENELCPNRNIWVSESFAENSGGIVDMTLMFRKNRNIKASYEDMRAAADLGNVSADISWVYDTETRTKMRMETLAYRICTVFVLLCGFLILYNIVQISVMTNIKLYGRMMTVGAAPSQVRYSILRQMHLLAFAGIAAGLITGYALGTKLVPVILSNSGGWMIVSAKASEFIIAALMTYCLVMISALIPAVKASKVNPSDLLNEENIYSFHKQGTPRIQGFPALFQMSLSYIGRFRKRNILTILLLSAGLVGLSSIYVVNTSFDVKKYMSEIAISDFTISEKTLMNGWGDYDTKGTTLSDKVIGLVDEIEGLQKKGTLYSQDVMIKAPDTAYENITEYYEQNNGQILKYMGENSSWSEGYRRFKDTNECIASVFGVDGIVSDRIFSEKELDGTIDKEKFIMGNYAIAHGFEGSSSVNKKQPTYNVGEKVNIDGHNFEIMAIIDVPYPITEGKENEGAAFNLRFFIPKHQFEEMYPENTMRRLFFNVEDIYRPAAELFVEKNFTNSKIPTVSPKSLKENYEKETKAASMITNMIVYMILVIGLINLLNTLITSVQVRKKEFAMMQSIGMTKKQLSILLVFEGLNIIGITLLISYFISFVAISTGVKAYLATQWTATYHFTITPLLMLTPILILISVTVPYICMKNMQKEEIMDRLYGDIEMGNSF